MTKRTLGVAAVFLVGCAVGGASSQLAVPKAHADQDAELTKWEYTCVNVHRHDATETSNKLGAEGWEMTTVRARETDGDIYCFKRPKM